MNLGVNARSEGKVGPEAQADVAAINNVEESYWSALNNGDLDGMGALLTEDSIFNSPNKSALIGKTAIQEYWQGVFDQSTIEIAASTDDVVLAED